MKNLEKSFFNFGIKKFLIILGLALGIRLVLMPTTLHADLLGHAFSSYFLAYEGKWNLYDTLAGLPKDHPLVKNFGVSDVFIYPPLAYYTLGLFRQITKPFAAANFVPWVWENLSDLRKFPGFQKEIFLFKFPYLFVDILLAFLLAGCFKEQRQKRQAFLFWLFNPLTLYATFMIGQIDILATFFTVLALFLFTKKKYSWAAFSIGIGASYKMYPLFLLFPLVFLAKEKFWGRMKLIIVGVAPFVFFIAPYLGSSAFRAMVLFSPKSQKMLFMGWPVSGAEVVYPFIIFLTIIYFFSFYTKKKIPLAAYFLAILLLIFSVTHYHPQWFLWLTPFLIWELVENNFRHLLLILTFVASWLIITLFFEPSLSYGLFNPLFPELDRAKGLTEILSPYTNVFQLKSLVRSVFAGASVFLVFRLFTKSGDED